MLASDARASARGAILVLVIAAVLGVVVYRPWAATPFAIYDFAEFLPFVKRDASFAERLRAMTAFYQQHGRYNVVGYAAVIAKWDLFGARPELWQILRAAQMVAIVGATFSLTRRLGRSVMASVAGAALLLVATGAASAWTFLTTGEPFAVLLLLLAAHCALGLRHSAHWVPRALVIAAAAAVIVLTKEVLVVLLPFVAFLLVADDGVPATRGAGFRDRRIVASIAIVAATTSLALVPVFTTLLRMPASGYASNYNASHVSARALAGLLTTMLLPVRLESTIAPGLRGAALLADALYAIILVGGWTLGLRTVGRRALAPLAAASSLPLALALVYLPLPFALNIYLLPALVGDALLLALALDFIGAYARPKLPVALAAYAFCFLAATLIAYQGARQSEATRIVDGEVVAAIARLAVTTPVVVAMPEADLKPPPNQWMGLGPILGRNATARFGRPLLPVTDAACRYAPALARRGVPVIVPDGRCRPLPRTPAVPFRSYYRYLDFRGVALDSVQADLLLPMGRR